MNDFPSGFHFILRFLSFLSTCRSEYIYPVVLCICFPEEPGRSPGVIPTQLPHTAVRSMLFWPAPREGSPHVEVQILLFGLWKWFCDV